MSTSYHAWCSMQHCDVVKLAYIAKKVIIAKEKKIAHGSW